MPWESLQVVGRIVIAEIVQKKKWIEIFRFAETKGALQLDAGTLNGRLGLNNLFYGAE